MPITTSPWDWYVWYSFSTKGKVRRQLMQEYVQKSTTTTLPCKLASCKGGLFIQFVKPAKAGSGVGSILNRLALLVITLACFPGRLDSSVCSSLASSNGV